MERSKRILNWSSRPVVAICCLATIVLTGCGPKYLDFRRDGLDAMYRGDYAPAAIFFAHAEEIRPRNIENLHDLGICHTMVARLKFEQRNHPAAFRELDRAIAYYERALDVRPGNLACTEGLNTALELKGQFERALQNAEWTAKFVGPRAKQHIFLAREYEKRGDHDAALLRYRQAVVMEPNNAEAHVAIADFLIRHRQDAAAIHHLRAALRIEPHNTWAREQLAARGALAPPVQTMADPT